MRVLLLDKDGNPLLVWQEDVSYRRNKAGFLAPGSREEDRVQIEVAGSLGDSEVAEAEAEGCSCEACESAEGC